MRVESTRFGAIEAEDARLYTSPEGVPGLSGRAFLLVAPEGLEAPFWLQSTEEPGRALLLLDPRTLDPSYGPSPGAMAELLGEPAENLLLRTVVWPAEEEGKLYANLFAPVWLAPKARRFAQVPMVGSGHELRVRFEVP